MEVVMLNTLFSGLAIYTLAIFEHPTVRFTILSFLYSGVLLNYLNSGGNLLFGLGSCLLGPLGEIAILHTSSRTWSYSQIQALKIPFWLLPLWGIATLSLISYNSLLPNVRSATKR